MGKVAMKLEVTTEGPHVDMEKLKTEVENAVHPESIEVKEIGFGLKSLIILITVEDKGGAPDIIENKLKSIDGVSGVNSLDITLI